MKRSGVLARFWGALIGLLSGAALAQQGPADNIKASLTTLDEIVVSTSRLQSANFTAPTPVTELTSKDFEARAMTNVADILLELPVLRPVANTGFSTTVGGNFISLRGLGQQRALVLVDGRRFVASALATNAVDVNVIPASLIERIDVVTSGASAAWGSDAITGVSNFIFKKKIQGIQGNVQYGRSEMNDGISRNVSLAWGTGFAGDRGQLMLAGEWNDLSHPVILGNRGWGRTNVANVANITINGVTYARATLAGLSVANAAAGGLIIGATATVNNAANNAAALAKFRTTANGFLATSTQYDATGQPVIFNYGAQINPNSVPAIMLGGDGPTLWGMQYLQSPLTRKSFYGRSTYDFGKVTGFVEASFADAFANQPQFPFVVPNVGDSGVVVTSGNPFIPAATQSIMTANNIAQITLGRVALDLPASISQTRTQTTRFAAGLDGKFGETGRWTIYGTHGKTGFVGKLVNSMIEANFRAATDVVRDAAGNPICRINSTAPADIAIVNAVNASGAPSYAGAGASPGCVAANPFGTNSFTQAVGAYVQGTSVYQVDFNQDVVEGTVQGEPVSTWAGPISVAGGAGYRREAILATSDAISIRSTASFPSGGFQTNNLKPIDDGNGGAKALTVGEAFAEVNVPLLANKTLAKSLDLNAAARFTNYSTSGSVRTWKFGGTFKPIDDILLRATRSRDIRAANLNELYSGSQLGSSSITDFDPRVTTSANGLQYLAGVLTQGNPTLQPETADSTSIGVSMQPRFLPGLNVSIDSYKINLTNQIGSLGGPTIVNGCFGKNNVPLNPSLCSLINRDPVTSRVSTVLNVFLNIASTKTSGVDWQMSYRTAMSNIFRNAAGDLTVRVLGSYLREFVFNNGLNTVDQAGSTANSPHWRYTISANYQTGPVSYFVEGRYLGNMKVDNTFNVTRSTDILDNNVPSRTYVDASVQYALERKENRSVDLTFRITNLFDRDPPLIATNNIFNGAVQQGVYDVAGRAFILGVRFKM